MLNLEAYLKQQIEATLQELDYPYIDYQFDRPKLDAHGDISVNLAMMLARPLKQNPRQIATQITESLNLGNEQISKIDIAGPGFINFFIAPSALHKTVETVLDQKDQYGRVEANSKGKAQVEFVSANPTGPLTVGHGRQAVLGDTISNILSWAGYDVSREYYFNNAGRQMRVLGNSVRVRYLQLLGDEIEFPEDHYQGEYIRDIAAKLKDEHGGSLRDREDHTIFKDAAETEIFKDIKHTLAELGIVFDTFYNESDLYQNGKIDAVIGLFKEKDLAYEKDGALWFRSTQFGLDQDRVIVKSTGEPTYRLPDIAYHRTKIERGFDLIVDIFGADHIATYPDVMAGLKALGDDTDKIRVLIHQFVTLFEGNEKVKMSTRKANFETLEDLARDVGRDATRWFFSMRSIQSHLNFDMKLARTKSNENPVYYNQYAHARICQIFRKAESSDMAWSGKADFGLLNHDSEFQLIKNLMRFPKVILTSAREMETHLLTQYMSDLSTAFHKFYTDCIVVDSENPGLTQARLGLCEATRLVLANGFDVLNVTAPETM